MTKLVETMAGRSTRGLTLAAAFACLAQPAAGCGARTIPGELSGAAGDDSTPDAGGALDAEPVDDATAPDDASFTVDGAEDVTVDVGEDTERDEAAGDAPVRDGSRDAPQETGPGMCPFIDGLVAYYPFDGDARDHSGHGYDASATDVTLEPGVLGSAYAFNGVSSGVTVTTGETAPLLRRTFCAWVSPTPGTAGLGLPVILSGVLIEPPTNQADQLSIAASGGNTGSCPEASPGAPLLDHYGSGCVSSSLTVQPGPWSFACYQADGAQVSFYVDGAISSRISKGVFSWHIPAIGIGTNPPIGGTSGPAFNGGIDEVTLWSRVLGQDELAALYNRGRACAPR